MKKKALLIITTALALSACGYFETVFSIPSEEAWITDKPLAMADTVQVVQIPGVPAGFIADYDSSRTVEVWIYMLEPPVDTPKLPIISRMRMGRGFTFSQTEESLTAGEGTHVSFIDDHSGGLSEFELLRDNTQNIWTHFAWVMTPRYFIQYVNGSVQAYETRNMGVRQAFAPLLIGAATRDGSAADLSYEEDLSVLNSLMYSYNGYIKDLAVFDHERSAVQINQDYSASLTGEEEGLIGLWRMDEGEGQTVSDLSSSGNHGYLGSAESDDINDPSWERMTTPPENTERFVLRFGGPQ